MIPDGLLPSARIVKAAKAPSGVRRQIEFKAGSVNQMLPSGPAVIAFGLLPASGIGNSVIEPSRAIRPILYAEDSSFNTSMMKYRLLSSGPAVIAEGRLDGVLISKYVTALSSFRDIRPI